MGLEPSPNAHQAQLDEHLATNQEAAGSNPAMGPNTLVVQLDRIRSSEGRDTGSIPVKGTNYVPVAQLEGHRASTPTIVGSSPTGDAKRFNVARTTIVQILKEVTYQKRMGPDG